MCGLVAWKSTGTIAAFRIVRADRINRVSNVRRKPSLHVGATNEDVKDARTFALP